MLPGKGNYARRIKVTSRGPQNGDSRLCEMHNRWLVPVGHLWFLWLCESHKWKNKDTTTGQCEFKTGWTVSEELYLEGLLVRKVRVQIIEVLQHQIIVRSIWNRYAARSRWPVVDVPSSFYLFVMIDRRIRKGCSQRRCRAIASSWLRGLPLQSGQDIDIPVLAQALMRASDNGQRIVLQDNYYVRDGNAHKRFR